jgi:hypothetical protein
MPEALRFRYRLEGVDDWQDPGTRRAVSYTNLGPGEYRFRVMAADQFGQWNDEEASIAVRILPTFTQTRCSTPVCAGGGRRAVPAVSVVAAPGHHALRHPHGGAERIARALHDSFLQSVHGLTMSFQSALSGLPEDSVARQKIDACC